MRDRIFILFLLLLLTGLISFPLLFPRGIPTPSPPPRPGPIEPSPPTTGADKRDRDEGRVTADLRFDPRPDPGGGIGPNSDPEAGRSAEANREGITRLKEGRTEEAITLFLKARLGDPDNAAVRHNLAEARALLAWKRLKEGREAEAEREALAAATLDADAPSAHKVLGEIHYRRNDLAAALSSWESALRLAPEDAELPLLISKVRKEAQVEGGFDRRETPHFTVSFEGREDREAARLALEFLESAHRDVGRALQFFPTESFAVILYPRETFRDVTAAPTWMEGLFDGKIRLPSGNSSNRPEEFRKVLYHEYMHAAIHRMAGGKSVPAWVHEGLAQYAETLAGRRWGERGRRSPIPLETLHEPFARMDAVAAAAAYEESRLAAAELISVYGLSRVRELLERIGAGLAFEAAFEQAFLISYDSFERRRERS